MQSRTTITKGEAAGGGGLTFRNVPPQTLKMHLRVLSDKLKGQNVYEKTIPMALLYSHRSRNVRNRFQVELRISEIQLRIFFSQFGE